MDTPNYIVDKVISTNLSAMQDMLEKAAALAAEGSDLMDKQDIDGAMAVVADLDWLLSNTRSLHEVCLELRRG